MEELLKVGAAYIRVSTDDQTELSPDSQIKKIQEYAKSHGYIVPDEYIFHDDGISGRTTKKRPGFNKMIAIAKTDPKPFDAIFVWKFSRFARSREDSVVFKSMLKKRGIDVISVSETIGDDKTAILMESLIEAMDEYYSVNLSEEVLRGMTEKVSRGEPVVFAPFGYLNADKTYIPDEESGKADIVREIFERYANGEKQREIAVSLGQRGVRTNRGNRLENRWIDYILWNPAYIGKIRWTPDGSHAASKRDYDNENIQISDGNWQPLISMELWEKVQGMLRMQKKAYPKYAKRQQPIQYMLKGLVRCDNCGGSIAMCSVVSGKSKIRTMQCCNYAKGPCTVSHSITIPRIESAFIEGLKKAYLSKKFAIDPQAPKKSATPNQVDYDKLIVVEERRLARAKEAFLAEIDTLEQYGQNKKEITARIEKLIAMRDKDTSHEIDADAFAKRVADVVEYIERDDVTEQAKNEALHTIIEKVVYEKAKNNLAIYFHDIQSS